MFDEVRDYDKLKEAWVGWRDASGKKMKDLFTEFVELQNSAATAAGKYENISGFSYFLRVITLAS